MPPPTALDQYMCCGLIVDHHGTMTLMSNDQTTQTKPWMVQGASGQEQPEATEVVRFFVQQQIGLCFQAAGGVPSHGSVEVELEKEAPNSVQSQRRPGAVPFLKTQKISETSLLGQLL